MPHATAVMFCSATPAFTYWLGNRSMKSLRTPKPRSPLTIMIWSSRAASSVSAWTNASRMAGHDIDTELQHGCGIFRALRRAIMPQHFVLHERDPAPFDCVGDYANRSVVRSVGQCRSECVVIVPVHPNCAPAERAQLG